MNEEQLRDALRDIGLAQDDLEAALPPLRAFQGLDAAPTPAETAALVVSLAPYLYTQSPVRLAARSRRSGLAGRVAASWELVAAQAAVVHRGFWIASLVVAGLAGLAVSQTSLSRTLIVYTAGPLLAYVAVALGLRAERAHAVEYELACPPSARELTLARLALILGYQLLVGLCLSAILAGLAIAPLQQAVSLWLAPLLLGVGATLTLSLGMPVTRAATLVYAAWLTVIAVAARSGLDAAMVAPAALAVMAVGGLLALAVAVALLPRFIPAMLARSEPSWTGAGSAFRNE